MAEASSSMSGKAPANETHITEDEASLYDRQIRLWGLEAQNRMRSSTVLVLSLRSLAHETIKNLVLAGIGRLIVMDDGVVTEEDLGGGFLFREEEGAVGQERTAAAAPQISSLNPLVSLTVLPTLAPFVRDSTGGAQVDTQQEIVDFLKRESVDVVVACDMTVTQLETIDAAARAAGSKFYGAGTYGFLGYVFADLGAQYDYVYQQQASKNNPSPPLTKRQLAYPPLSSVLDQANWSLSYDKVGSGGSPYRGVTRLNTKHLVPSATLGILSVWEFQRQKGRLPSSTADHEEFVNILEKFRLDLGINSKSYSLPAGQEPYDSVAQHLSAHASRFFPPTLAVLGGFLAQDVLRALSQKDTPIVNLLVVDSMEGSGVATRWAMNEPVDV